MITVYVSATGASSGNGSTPEEPVSLARAQARVREITSNGTSAVDNISVQLLGDVDVSAVGLTFGAEDSNVSPYVTRWGKVPGGATPVLECGVQIPGPWTDEGSGVWSAATPVGFNTRQFYVNGTRAKRAGVDISTGENPDTHQVFWPAGQPVPANEDIEFSTSLKALSGTLMKWIHLRVCATSKTTSGGYTSFGLCPNHANVDNWYYADYYGGSYEAEGWSMLDRAENAREFITDEGDFYLDHANARIYYKKRGSESLDDAWLAKQEHPIVVDGASNIYFDDLIIQHAAWNRVTELGIYLAPLGDTFLGLDTGRMWDREGYPGTDFGNYYYDPTSANITERSELVSSAIHIAHATNVRVNRCVLRHLGGAGVRIHAGAHECGVSGSHIYDVSGVGVTLNSVAYQIGEENSAEQIRDTVLRSNKIHDVGVEYFDSPAVLVYGSKNNQTVHNELFNVPYCGFQNTNPENVTTIVESHEFAYNKVHDVMCELIDGGGVYANGKRGDGVSRSTCHHNHIYDVRTNATLPTTLRTNLLYCDDWSRGADYYENALEAWTPSYQTNRWMGIGVSDQPAPDGWYVVRAWDNYVSGSVADLMVGNLIPGYATASDCLIEGYKLATSYPAEWASIVAGAGVEELLLDPVEETTVIAYGWTDTTPRVRVIGPGSVSETEWTDGQWRAIITGYVEGETSVVLDAMPPTTTSNFPSGVYPYNTILVISEACVILVNQ